MRKVLPKTVLGVFLRSVANAAQKENRPARRELVATGVWTREHKVHEAAAELILHQGIPEAACSRFRFKFLSQSFRPHFAKPDSCCQITETLVISVQSVKQRLATNND